MELSPNKIPPTETTPLDQIMPNPIETPPNELEGPVLENLNDEVPEFINRRYADIPRANPFEGIDGVLRYPFEAVPENPADDYRTPPKEIIDDVLQDPSGAVPEGPVLQDPSGAVPQGPFLENSGGAVPQGPFLQDPIGAVPQGPFLQDPSGAVPQGPFLENSSVVVPEVPVIENTNEAVPENFKSYADDYKTPPNERIDDVQDPRGAVPEVPALENSSGAVSEGPVLENPNWAVAENIKSYADDYKTPPSERIDDVGLPYVVPIVDPSSHNFGIYADDESNIASNLSLDEADKMYFQGNQEQAKLVGQLMANLQRNSGPDQQMHEAHLQKMDSLQQNSPVPDRQNEDPQQTKGDQEMPSHQRNSSQVPDQQNKYPQQSTDYQQMASHQRASSQVPDQQTKDVRRMLWLQRNRSLSQEQQIEDVRRMLRLQRNSSQVQNQQNEYPQQNKNYQQMASHQRASSEVPNQQIEEVPRVVSQQRNIGQFQEQQIEDGRQMFWLQRNSSHLLDQQMENLQRMINRSSRIEDIGAATGFNPGASATGRKILGRGGRDIKSTKATQTLIDTSGTENKWIHESRRKADALCEEITNLINLLFHAPVSPRNQRGSIASSLGKNAVPPTGDQKSSAERTVHEHGDARKKALEHQFYFQLNRRITIISDNANSLRRSIPLPITDEERRFPTPESPPVVLQVQDATLPLEQDVVQTLHQSDLAASGYQRDITSDLANMTLYETTCQDFSPSSIGMNPRRKQLRSNVTGGRAPQSRSPFLYKSPPQSSKSHAKRMTSAQKDKVKDSVRHPCTRKPEPIHTGAFGGARLKISSTSVWSKGSIITSTPHGGKSSEVSAIGVDGTSITQATSLASDATAVSIGEPQATDSNVENPVATITLDIAPSLGEVKASIFRARTAPAIDVEAKVYNWITSSSEQTQKKSTKPNERTRPASHTTRAIGKDKASQAPKFNSTTTRVVPSVPKGTSKYSQVPKVASASEKDTRGVAKAPPKDKIPIPKGMSASETSSNSGAKTATQTSAVASGRSQNTKEITNFRQFSDKGKKKAPQATKFFSKTGSKSGRACGMNIVVKTTNASCVLKNKSRTTQASKATTTTTSSGEKNGAAPKSEEVISTRVVKGSDNLIPKSAASASLPKDENVTKSPKKPSTSVTPNRASAIPQRRLSDRASDAGAVRSIVADMSNMSLGFLRPRGTGHLEASYLNPDTLQRRVSHTSDEKETPQKKPHSY